MKTKIKKVAEQPCWSGSMENITPGTMGCHFSPTNTTKKICNDLEQAFNFGKNSINNSKHLSIEEIPVQLDWISKSKSYFKSVAVEYISENCTKCGVCAKHCPTGVIATKTGDYLSKKAKADCIACMACVFECKYEARIIEVNFINILILRTHLKKVSVQRLEPVVIFP